MSKVDNISKSQAYELNCRDCDKFHIGTALRNFKVHQEEHSRTLQKMKSVSIYSNHPIAANHKFNFDLGMLHSLYKKSKTGNWETLEINTHKKKETLT